MDRLQFMHKLERDGQDFASMVITSFNQFMALYSLVGHIDDMKIQNENNLSFTVSSDASNIRQLKQIIEMNNSMIVSYDTLFRIAMNNESDTCARITLY